VSLFKPVLELNLLGCRSLTPSAPQKEVISGIEGTILARLDETSGQGRLRLEAGVVGATERAI